MKKRFILPLTAFALLISFGLAACNNGGGESKPAQSAQQQKIKVTAADNKTKLLKGETVQLSADVDGVTWESNKPEIASVSGAGLVTALTKGSASISASKDGYKTGSISITVDYPNITVTAEGNKTTLMYGESVKLSSDKDGVAWSSSNEAVATVDQTGLVVSVSKGSATIKATKADHNDGVIEITVNYPDIAITSLEDKTKLQLNETLQLSADKDGVTWSSSNNAIASVSSDGLVTALKYGKVKIVASKEHHNDGEISIEVVRPAPSAVLHMEDAEHYSADGSWTSSNRGPGSTPVYKPSSGSPSDGTCIAYFGAGDKETVKFTSDKAIKAEVVLMIGYYYSIADLRNLYDVKFNDVPVTFDEQGYEAEGTTGYTYKPLSFGELDIIAGQNVLEIEMKTTEDDRYPYMDDLNFYAAEEVTIVMVQDPLIEVEEHAFSLAVGETAQINSETTGLTYVSSNEEVATVDTNGLITAVANGGAVITVSKDGMRPTKINVRVADAFSGAEYIFEAEEAFADSSITFRTPSANSNASGATTNAWPAGASLVFRFKSTVEATVDLVLRGRANPGSNGYTYSDVDLATAVEIKINGVVATVGGTISGSTISDYPLGDMNVGVGDNTIEIKCLTAAPTIDYLKLSPKAAA